MKHMMIFFAGILVLVGLAMLLPGAMQWDILQIQAGLGKPDLLKHEALKMLLGVLLCGTGWFVGTHEKEN